MRTRSWLTTPEGQAPATDERIDGERYVPGPGPVHEPRVPSGHRRAAVVITGLVVVIVLAGLFVLGEQAQRDDPSIPDVPDEPDDGQPDPLELPET